MQKRKQAIAGINLFYPTGRMIPAGLPGRTILPGLPEKGHFMKKKKIVTTIYIDRNNRHRVKWFTTQAASDECERQITTILEYKQVQRPLSLEQRKWLECQKPKHIECFVSWGIIDNSDLGFIKPLSEMVDEWIAEKIRDGQAPQHVAQCRAHITGIIDRLGAVFTKDVTRELVETALAEMEKENHWSPRTRDAWLVDNKTFFHWAVETKHYFYENPIKQIPKSKRVEKRRERGYFKVEWCSRLITAAFNSTVVYKGLSGLERTIIYLLGIYGGWRWNEIRLLQRHDFVFDGHFCEDDPPLLAPAAEKQKARRPDIVVLRKDHSQMIKAYFAANPAPPDARAFPLQARNIGAQLIAFDLAATGDTVEAAAEKIARGEQPLPPIPAKDERGRVYDFHALRHTLATMLDRAGISDGVANQLTRHSAHKSLRLGVYTHADFVDQTEALEQLPSLIPVLEN